MRRLISMVLAACFLAGCSLAPAYRQPKSPVPPQWPGGPTAERNTGYTDSIGRVSAWQDQFPDEGLRRVIEIALENNRDLRIAALNVERARTMYDIGRAEVLPVATGSGAYSRERVPKDLSLTGNAVTTEQYSVGLGATAWELDFFGRIRNLKDSTLEEYAAMRQTRRAAGILLVSETANAWFSLAADRDNLELARSTLTAQDASCGIIKSRYENGVASELDLRRARSQVETARRDTALFMQRAAQSENALDLLAGSSLSRTLMPSGMTDIIPPVEVVPGLSSEVLLSRPDVLAAEHRLKAAHANIGAARAAFFPRITLTSSLGTASRDLSGLFESGSGLWSFLPRLSFPIFDGRTRPAYEVSKVEREMAVAEYEKSIQAAFREVADALAKRETLDERIAAQKALVEAARETCRISQARYDDGIDSYLSVLDAQRSLYGTSQGLIMLQLEKLANLVVFYKALGGWQTDASGSCGGAS